MVGSCPGSSLGVRTGHLCPSLAAVVFTGILAILDKKENHLTGSRVVARAFTK